MSIYGVTNTGFKRKPRSVILEELENLMKAKFGQDLDISPESPEGNIISVILDATAPLWEVAEHSYNAFNPNASTGVTLENLAQINNLKKKAATPTTVTITFTGNEGIIIPLGTTVSSNKLLTGGTTYKFTTEAEGIITSGTSEVLAISDLAGKIQIPLNSMTLLDNPIVGITSLTNEEVGNVGRDYETDAELRARRTLSVSLPAVSTIEAIRSGLLEIESILSVKIYENDTSSTIGIDSVSIPPHAIKPIIQGSATPEEKALIAKVLFDRKDPGVVTDGLVSETLQDSQGFDKTFNWDVPELVPIYITVTTKRSTSTSLPDGGSEIIDAIVAYITDPITGYKIGDEVSYGRLFTPINSVPDHYVQSVKIGFAPFPVGMADLDITGAQLAVVSNPATDITIVTE